MSTNQTTADFERNVEQMQGEIDSLIAGTSPRFGLRRVSDMSTKETTDYPVWVCPPCGSRYGRREPTMATWHAGTCGVCGRASSVTEPRDYGHLRPDWKQHD